MNDNTTINIILNLLTSERLQKEDSFTELQDMVIALYDGLDNMEAASIILGSASKDDDNYDLLCKCLEGDAL